MTGLGAGGSTSVTPEAGHESPTGASRRGPHRLAAIDVCERMWALRYHYNYRKTVEKPWTMGGTLIHTCYEYYYASLMPDEWRRKHCPWFYQRTLEERLKIQGRDWPDLVDMAKENLSEYMNVYRDEPVTPLYIEREFSARLGEIDPGGPWPELDDEEVTCRTDLVFENESGLWIMDYKSLGRSKCRRDGTLMRWKEDGEYALNWQVLVNLWLVRHELGSKVRGFIVQRTTRHKPYDFDRHVLTVPVKAYKETPRQLRYRVHHEREVVRKLEAGERPKASFHACYGRYGPCDYWDACKAPDDASFQAIIASDFDRPTPKLNVVK